MYPVNPATPWGLRIHRELFLIFPIYHRRLTSVWDNHRNLDCNTVYVLEFEVAIIYSRHRAILATATEPRNMKHSEIQRHSPTQWSTQSQVYVT